MRPLLLPLAAVLFLYAAPRADQATQAPPPQQPPAPVFRSATNVVEVDVIVKDRDGRFVSGLTARDFELLEEGRPQKIDHLYLVSSAVQAPVEPSAVAAGLPRGEDRSGRRIFVLIFDWEHLSMQALLRMKAAAAAFLDSEFQPGDLGGVYANGALWKNRLTTEKPDLIEAIKSAQTHFETGATRQATLREWPAVDGDLEAVRLDVGDRHLLEEMTDRACRISPPQCELLGSRAIVMETLERKAQEYVRDARNAADRTLLTIAHVSANLARLEGRKTVALLSEGFFVEDVRGVLPELAARAARSGITVYAINARGTEAVGGRTFSDSSSTSPGLSLLGDTSQEGLDILASQTGGLSFRRMDNFRGALNAIASDTSTYYVLGYSPANGELDGTYRQIELKVKWEGVTVRARRGYLATPLPPPRRPTIVR
jgi:VWFA-related protein